MSVDSVETRVVSDSVSDWVSCSVSFRAFVSEEASAGQSTTPSTLIVSVGEVNWDAVVAKGQTSVTSVRKVSSSSSGTITNQRKSNATNLFDKARIASSDSVTFNPEKQVLTILWNDGHKRQFRIQELVSWAVQPAEYPPIELWNSTSLRKVPRTSLKNFDFAKFCLDFVKYGVVTVDDVDPTPEATETLCRAIAPIHDTFFGDFWVFGTDEETSQRAREDTAYTSEGIGPHTDGTYFNQTPGIQVFHCLKPAKTGGETVLVDGFQVAESFKTAFPDHFNLLCTKPVEHHYLEGVAPDPNAIIKTTRANHLHSRSIYFPIIRLHAGQFTQVRFNPYDRAPYAIGTQQDAVEEAIMFYEAYTAFSQFVHAPENAITLTLKPGTAIFVDNYRVLHARTAFTGSRKMCGAYLSRDNFLAKARTVLPEAFKNL